MTSKKTSKIKTLELLLSWIERGESRKTICQLANFSEQALSYHICRLKANGFIEQANETRPYLYRLSPLGTKLKQMLGQSDNSFTDVWRCHAMILGFPIEDWGSWKFNDRHLKHMNNWTYQEIPIKRHKVQITSSGTMKIYCPEIYATVANEGFDKLVEEGTKMAAYIASKYGMKIGQRYRIREGHHELIGSESLAKFLGHIKVGGVYIDISDKEQLKPRLEEKQDGTKLKELLDMPDRIEKVEKAITELLVPAVQEHSRDIRLHLAVLEEIRDAIKELKSK